MSYEMTVKSKDRTDSLPACDLKADTVDKAETTTIRGQQFRNSRFVDIGLHPFN